ncbi:MAG: hypothetical protein NT062_06785, partial [Proteobacteria bacterium]|nr:hypothetical protein [Pseudomonadota bacterium]
SQYFIVDLSTFATTHTASIMQNKTSILGVSQRQAPHLEHPTFNADNVSAPITEFYNLTAAHAATPATCEVPAGRLLD